MSFGNDHKNNYSKQWTVIYLYTIGKFICCHIHNYYEKICNIITFNHATPNINYLWFYVIFPCRWHLIYHKITNNSQNSGMWNYFERYILTKNTWWKITHIWKYARFRNKLNDCCLLWDSHTGSNYIHLLVTFPDITFKIIIIDKIRRKKTRTKNKKSHRYRHQHIFKKWKRKKKT